MSPIFDPDRLHEVARTGVGLPLDEAFDTITRNLAQAYPGHIDEGPRRWLLNNAGGAMGEMFLLHASLSEYILIFGTPIGTEGHSGRYRTEVWDFVFAGEMWTYIEGEVERTVTGPGEGAYLGADRSKGYRVPDFAWMLEYARGPIPTMLPFGLADSMFSTLDVRTTSRTVVEYGKHVVKSLSQSLLGGPASKRLSGRR